jgi:hypothetical protein
MLRGKEAWQNALEEFIPLSENPGIGDLCRRKVWGKKVRTAINRIYRRCPATQNCIDERFGVVSCRVVSCRVVSCGVVWCGVVYVWCGVVWCGVVWCVCVCVCVTDMKRAFPAWELRVTNKLSLRSKSVQMLLQLSEVCHTPRCINMKMSGACVSGSKILLSFKEGFSTARIISPQQRKVPRLWRTHTDVDGSGRVV